MKYKTVSFSKPGRNKPNQDSTLIKEFDDNSILLGIADGMGGKQGGDKASQSAVEAVSIFVDQNPFTSVDELFKEAHKSVAIKSQELDELADMATTLSLVFIQNGKAMIGHVGDCRVYHLRANGLLSRTKDQTEVQRLIDDGILTKQRAIDYHRKNVLLSVLDASGNFELQVSEFATEPGDRVILLTDGAYSLLKKDQIRDISVSSDSIENLISEMQRIIESQKVRDDYSVVICEIH